jgi:hypothetical protein
MAFSLHDERMYYIVIKVQGECYRILGAVTAGPAASHLSLKERVT